MCGENFGFERPEIIPGLDFTPEEVEFARKNNQVLSMDLEITEACQAACIYCYRYQSEGAQPPAPNELSLSETLEILTDAHENHGLQRLCILGGEPLVPSIRGKYLAVLAHCNKLGIKHVTFTNGLALNRKTAEQLREHKASLCLKLTSLDPGIHDKLVGVPGSLNKALEAFSHLFELGYGKGDKECHLAFETVITGLNYNGLEDLWIWARHNGVIPYVEKLTVQGRGAKHIEDLRISNEQLRKKFVSLNSIDRTMFGISWDVVPPIAGYHCNRFYHSLYIRADGMVRPCVGTEINLGNLKTQTIGEILVSPMVQVTRNIDKFLKGACGTCDLSGKCYGCRGAAYQAGDLFMQDPNCWRHTNEKIPADTITAGKTEV